MTNITRCLLTLLLCWSGVAVGQWKTSAAVYKNLASFPSYRKVVDEFFSHYTAKDYPYKAQNFSFAKKQDGWWVEVFNYSINTEEPQQEYKFWDAGRNRWEALPVAKGADDTAQIFRDYFAANQYFFDQSVFYGYDQWTTDDIRVLEPLKDRDSYLTYHLARAYSNLAHQQLNYASGTGTTANEHSEQVHLNRDKLAPALESFRRDIQLMQEALVLDPTLETIVGQIRTKWSNEYLDEYLMLGLYGYHALADSLLPGGLYDPFMVTFAENLLNSCPPHSILFTQGDNDTYPLLYAQAQLHFREDVTVVNINLTNLPLTRYYLAHRLPDSLQVHYTIPEDTYLSQETDYIYLSDSSFTLDLSAVTDTLNFYSGLQASTGTYRILRLQGDSIRIMTDPAKAAYLYHQRQYLSSFKLSQKDKTLEKQDLFMLDVLANEINLRPLCIANSMAPRNYSLFANHLWDIGMVYEVVPEYTGSGTRPRVVNDEAAFLQRKLQWQFGGTDTLQMLRFSANYISMYQNVVNQCADSPDSLLVKDWVTVAESRFPDFVRYSVFNGNQFAYLLLRAREYDKLKPYADHCLLHYMHLQEEQAKLPLAKRDMETIGQAVDSILNWENYLHYIDDEIRHQAFMQEETQLLKLTHP